ncbi:MAG: response regulator transcription factor [Chloroflexaceae bacterium]|nr:response regulator transcription factor [Chloroflexaceae bacterium]
MGVQHEELFLLEPTSAPHVEHVTVVLAERTPVVRQGLRRVLETHPPIEPQRTYEVVGETTPDGEAVSMVARLKPHVLLIEMPMVLLDVMETFQKASPKTRIVFYTGDPGQVIVTRALKLGAAGVVLKESPVCEILLALRSVMKGQRYLSPPLQEYAIQALIKQAQQTANDPYFQLTLREQEVFHLVLKGLTARQIADKLVISTRTAETHRINIMRKLGLRTQRDLFRYALDKGLDKEFAAIPASKAVGS